MNAEDREDLEIELVLEALDKAYGYDFRRYARASLRRRLLYFAQLRQLDRITAMIPCLLHDADFVEALVNGISVPVTEPFRDPAGLAAVREHVFPWLQSHAYSKLWVAGCASGEEVYSLAILLEEAGLLSRVQIYATDINSATLARAREGIYPLQTMLRAEHNYRRAGGRRQLADYYVSQYGSAKLASYLQRPLVFSQHNLATDAAFGEMQFILCRNVLIYFTRELQERVLQLFMASLVRRGFLVLGEKENLDLLHAKQYFETIDRCARLYRAL